MYISEEERLTRRAEKIEGWLDYLEALYGGLLSRPEETASVPGWDDHPSKRPCECRIEWQRFRLCLACDNTGWRPLADGEEGIDPYSAEVPKRASWLLIEPDATKRAAASRRMDATLDVLERNERIRNGLELPEGRDARDFRLVAGKSRTLAKILEALSLLIRRGDEIVRRASREVLARALAKIVPGELDWAPAIA